MTIHDRARDALNKATRGPWYTNSRQSRTFQEHVIVSPERGAYTICEMTDENAESAELVALSPELAAAVDRAAKLADELEHEADEHPADDDSLDENYRTAARIRAALEGVEE